MTEQDKQLISEYMGWTTEPYWWCEKCKEEKSPYHVTYNTNCSDCGCAVVIKEDHPFDSNNASLCVQEMQKRGEWTDYRLLAVTIWMNTKSDCEDITAWLMTIEDRQAKNFFKAFTEWRKMK